MAALSSAAACAVPPRRRMRRGQCMRPLPKLREESPDRLGAVDVAVLPPQQARRDVRKAVIRGQSGHALAAIVVAIEHYVVPGRAALRIPGAAGLFGRILFGLAS